MMTDSWNVINDQAQTIHHYFSRINDAVGKSKMPEIISCWDNPVAQKALVYLLDPQKVFHVKEKSLSKPINITYCKPYDDLFSMCDDLSHKPGVSDQDLVNVQNTLLHIKDNQLREYIAKFLCKTLTIGVTAKTVNKAIGEDVIPVFECMLANKYFEHDAVVDGQEFAITEKLDGIRCIAVVRLDAPVVLYTRQGQQIEGLVEVEEDLTKLRNAVQEPFVLDGELLVCNRSLIPSKEQYKQTSKIVRRDGEKHNIQYNVFDMLTLREFKDRHCSRSYIVRRNKLDKAINQTSLHMISALPILYQGKEKSKIIEHLELQRSQSHEGVMINLCDKPYEFKRTNNLLKVKVMNDCDLEIIGVVEGTGKFAGTLGSILVEYKGNTVGVGSGLSDDMRDSIWNNPDAYIGRIATIQYFEETNDSDGKLSIRFPVFKEIREAGKEVSYQ